MADSVPRQGKGLSGQRAVQQRLLALLGWSFRLGLVAYQLPQLFQQWRQVVRQGLRHAAPVNAAVAVNQTVPHSDGVGSRDLGIRFLEVTRQA